MLNSPELDLLRRTADAVAAALHDLDPEASAGEWALLAEGTHGGQHASDVVADAAALSVLERSGVGILSEETGGRDVSAPLVVVVDPLDGSTNAARRLPHYAVSLAAVRDGSDVVAAVVANLASGERFEAALGQGATCDRRRIRVADEVPLDQSIVGINGFPSAPLGWKQYRAYGSAALDISAVGAGRFDAYADCTIDSLGPWDYLAGALIVSEAGGLVADADGRELVVVDHAARRTPVAASGPGLLETLLESRAAVVG